MEWAELTTLWLDPRGQRIKTKLLITALSLTQPELKAILDWGVGGVVLKSVNSAQLLEAIGQIAKGHRFIDGTLMNVFFAILRAQGAGAGETSRAATLTPEERRLLPRLAEGFTNKVIAERLGLSDKTVENHVAKVFRKLYVANRAQFAARYARGDDLLVRHG